MSWNWAMNYKRFELPKLRNTHVVRVNMHGMPIGRDAYIALGSPERVAVYYDEEAKTIKLEAAEDGYRVSTNPAPHISCKLNRAMPCGKYEANGDNTFTLNEDIKNV